MSTQGPTIKVQTWGDDLRLPCFINPAETAGLLTELEHLRRPTIPFQSKHLPSLKRNKWYVLSRPVDKTRTGLLVIWPAQQCCIYVSGEPMSNKRPNQRIALLRLRIDPQMIADGVGLTVFAATLSSSARRLWVEDTLIWKGRNLLAEEVFSKRWRLAVQWMEHYCILDPRLLGGIEIEMAKWQPLSKMRPERVWELQSDDVGQRRHLWIARHADITEGPESPSTSAATVPILDSGPLIATASRGTGPEQWELSSADGVGLGRALVRTLRISELMRSSKSNTMRVEVVWNEGFKKWEVMGKSDSLSSHSTAFSKI